MLPEDNNNEDINVRDILLILRRRKGLIIGITILSVLLAVLFVFSTTPRYTAEAVMQINTRGVKVLDIESVVSGLSNEEAALTSELDIIRSRYLIGRVVDKLDLENNDDFLPKGSKLINTIKNTDIGKKVLDFFEGGVKSEELYKKEEHRRRKFSLVDKVIDNLYVDSKPNSYTIKIGFESEYPEIATIITNTIVDEYLLDQLETKFNETKRANEWLNIRMKELEEKVLISERVVQEFRERHGIVETKGITVTDQQLSELNTQIILARTEKALQEARLKNVKRLIRSRGVEATTEVLSSPLIQRLREQESEVLRKKSDLSSKYGDKHPKMINVRAELREIRRNIKLEITKIVKSLESEVEIAEIRELTLEKSLNALQNSVSRSGRSEIQLAQLERERDANQALYQAFLSRFKETSNQELEQSDARVISKAEVPINPSYPRKSLVILIAFFVGLSAGVGATALVEHLDNGFRSTEQVEKMLGVSAIGMIPTLKTKKPADYIVQKQTSQFAEAIRAVRTAIHFSNPDNNPKTIMVTSSVPQEGKSLFSISLARLTANAGAKVMLIDCDLRRPSIAKNLGIKNPEFTLDKVLTTDNPEEKFWYEDNKTGMHFIPSLPNTPNSQELLSSQKMKNLLEKLSEKYDLVVLDTPPVMALADSLTLSEIVDSVVFMTRWEETPRDVVRNAVKRLQSCNNKLSGVVLTRVNLQKHQKYGYGDSGYYYGKYKEYYVD